MHEIKKIASKIPTAKKWAHKQAATVRKLLYEACTHNEYDLAIDLDIGHGEPNPPTPQLPPPSFSKSKNVTF